jgi:hypothetical protein
VISSAPAPAPAPPPSRNCARSAARPRASLFCACALGTTSEPLSRPPCGCYGCAARPRACTRRPGSTLPECAPIARVAPCDSPAPPPLFPSSRLLLYTPPPPPQDKIVSALRARDAGQCSAALSFADTLKGRPMPAKFPIPHIGWARELLAALNAEKAAVAALQAAAAKVCRALRTLHGAPRRGASHPRPHPHAHPCALFLVCLLASSSSNAPIFGAAGHGRLCRGVLWAADLPRARRTP